VLNHDHGRSLGGGGRVAGAGAAGDAGRSDGESECDGKEARARPGLSQEHRSQDRAHAPETTFTSR